MSALSPSRPGLIRVSLAGLILALPCPAQSLPPSQPTTQQTPQPAAQPTPARPQPAAAHRATVVFDAGKLVVTADNSSLNQILRDIASLTGMTITGGVLDERVFGTYGPADTSTILSALLNGTGSNMLLLEDDLQAPHQLVLTPRQGGATPPSPTALRDPGESDLPPQLSPRFSRQPAPAAPQQTFNGALPSAPPQPTALPASPAPALASPASDIPTPPPADATTEQSPNGVKTPQQIYDQLLKLQQQQPKPPQ